jgi:hypothetical protein
MVHWEILRTGERNFFRLIKIKRVACARVALTLATKLCYPYHYRTHFRHRILFQHNSSMENSDHNSSLQSVIFYKWNIIKRRIQIRRKQLVKSVFVKMWFADHRWFVAVCRRFPKKNHCKNCMRHWMNKKTQPYMSVLKPPLLVVFNRK